jgi:hypothetical protein
MFSRVLLVLCLLTAATVVAAPVDAPDTRTVAQAKLARLDTRGVTIAWQDDITAVGRVVARVYGLAPTGYVVVAADTDLPPVVAYSLESSCPRDDGADPLRAMIAADLAGRLAAVAVVDPAVLVRWHAEWTDLRDGDAQPARFQQWPPAGSTPTGGWLASNWTQSAPYNNLCPLDIAHGGTRSQAGCPSVAMAMILNYHRTIQGTTLGTADRYWHAYAGNYYWIPDGYFEYGFPSFTTLNGYLQTLTAHWDAGTALTSTDKAALVFACGIAATQVYSAAGSGTFGVSQAYAAFQRFGFTDSRLVLDTDPDMYPDLLVEMQNARPAHLAIVDPAWSMGHNVVVDGYNSDNYYHLNFGWGGPYNGWYRLPQEIPYGLTVVEGLIMDIAPTSTPVEDDAPAAAALALANHPNPFNPRTVIRFTAPASGHARLAVYDLAGRLQAVLFDGVVAAGPHAISWGADDLASGVYVARIEVAGATASRRMALVR